MNKPYSKLNKEELRTYNREYTRTHPLTEAQRLAKNKRQKEYDKSSKGKSVQKNWRHSASGKQYHKMYKQALREPMTEKHHNILKYLKQCYPSFDPLNCDRDKVKELLRGYRGSKIQLDASKNQYLLHKFGITLDQYNSMKLAQNDKCAICHNKETHKLKGKVIELAIDHCHKTNKVRGLLCRNCNVTLGFVKDDVSILSNAIAYLNKGVNNG